MVEVSTSWYDLRVVRVSPSPALSADSRASTAEPRWLDPSERRVWLSWVFATRLLWEELERDLQRDAAMGFGYYDILVCLSESPGRTRRMSELADVTQSSRSRLSHAIARLEALGWIRREPCATDRRGANATLTDAGFAALEVAAPQHVESVRQHLFDQLTRDELEQLREINERLLEHLLPLADARGDSRARLLDEALRRLEPGDGC
jgi:DNA-binding MarR family transcriptional regulator